MIMMVVMVFMLIVVMVVMMLMLVMVMLIVVMVMMMLMLVMVMLIVVMVVIIMVMMMQVDMHFDGLAVFDDFQHEVRIHIIPGCCDDTGVRMRFLNQNTALFDTIRREVLGTAEDNGGSRLDLVEEEFAEVFHIHAALAGVNNGCRPADFNIVMTVFGLIDRSKNLAQFADTGRLNKNAVRMIGINELVNGLLEIAGQRAADAAGVQFGDCYSFSSRITFSSRSLPVRSFLISVVLPAPRKPEITLILTMVVSPYIWTRFHRIHRGL